MEYVNTELPKILESGSQLRQLAMEANFSGEMSCLGILHNISMTTRVINNNHNVPLKELLKPEAHIEAALMGLSLRHLQILENPDHGGLIMNIYQEFQYLKLVLLPSFGMTLEEVMEENQLSLFAR